MQYIATITFKEGDIIYKLTADTKEVAEGMARAFHDNTAEDILSVEVELYTDQPYDHDLDNIDDYDTETPFQEEWHDRYTVEGVNYDVTIQGIEPDNTGKNNYYLVVYSDGSTKDIIRDNGAWLERNAGETAHAVAIGTLIHNHFR